MYNLWSCQKVCNILYYLLNDTFIRFGLKLYRQIVGVSMGTNKDPLLVDLFCYERDFIMSLSDHAQAGVIESFNSTSRYLDNQELISFLR